MAPRARLGHVPLDHAIETEHLRLRCLAEPDVAALVALAGEWEIARWTSHIPHPYEPADAEGFIAHAITRFRHGEGYAFAITLAQGQDSDALIGTVAIELDASGLGAKEGEIGYWIGRPHQGQGHAGRAVAAALGFAARTLGLERIRATVARDNQASIRVLEKNRLRLTSRASQHWPARNAEIDVARYAIRAADIP